MKISTILGNNKNQGEFKTGSNSGEGVRSSKTFSKILENTEIDYTQKQLLEMVEKIKDAGSKLKSAATEENISNYKAVIKDYLTYVLRNYHKLKHDRSINYSTVYTRVEIINKEVEDLTNRLINEEQDNINVVAEIDKITGLIIDVYS